MTHVPEPTVEEVAVARASLIRNLASIETMIDAQLVLASKTTYSRAGRAALALARGGVRRLVAIIKAEFVLDAVLTAANRESTPAPPARGPDGTWRN